MANPYDQFDAVNPYDRFDAPAAQPQPEPGTIGIGNWRPSLTGMAGNLFNTAASAFTAPADVLSGRMAPGDVANRALDFATIATPGAAAMRAGEIVPGMMTRTQAPSIQQLKSAADAGYGAARLNPAMIPPADVANMARGVQQKLLSPENGIIAEDAPQTYGLLNRLTSPPPEGGFGTDVGYAYPGIASARDRLSTIAGETNAQGRATTDAKAATIALKDIDPLINNAYPEVADARANHAAAMRSNAITGDLNRANTGIVERAEARAEATHSGLNLDNNIRQRVATFLQSPENLRGFSDEEIQALKDVVRGSATQNVARYTGNILGGGGGIGGALVGALGGHYLGGEGGLGGEMGMALGLGLGRSLKGVENTLAARSLNPVDQMIRMRSPLAQAMQAQGLLSEPAMSRNSAVLRSILPGLLSQPPQNPNAQMGLLQGYI